MKSGGTPSAARDRLILLAAGLLSVLFVLQLNAVPVASNDLWLQIKVGQLTIDNEAIPRSLLFPFTTARGAAFNAHEWLSSVMFYEWTRAFGEAGLMPLQALLALVQFGLALALARRLSGSSALGVLMAKLAMLVVNYRYVLRPEMFALLLFLLLLEVMCGYRRDGRPARLLWTLPLAIAWANCHGSFLLGPVVAVIFAVGEALQAAFAPSKATEGRRLRRTGRAGAGYIAAAAGMLAASLVNPRGLELLSLAFKVQSSLAMKSVIWEWLPTLDPRFMSEPPFWIFTTVCLVSLALLAANWRALTATDMLLFVSFGALALQRNRHIVWFAFVDLAVCAHVAGMSRSATRFERAGGAAALILALAGLGVCAGVGNVRGDFIYASHSENFTSAMKAALAEPVLSGNVLNSYELGAELIYRDWPRLKPSIDSRIDSYGDAYFVAHQRLFTNESDLKAFLANHGVNYMLLLTRDFAGVSRMPGIKAEWHVRISDQKMLLLERNVALPSRTPDRRPRAGVHFAMRTQRRAASAVWPRRVKDAWHRVGSC